MGDNDKSYGVITEQGDLGLGFSALTESEKETVNKSENENKNDK